MKRVCGSLSLVLVFAFGLEGCVTTGSAYKDADWYKSTKRRHQLVTPEDEMLEIGQERVLKVEEKTQTAGVRQAVGQCPVRTAPQDHSVILRRTKFGERLWTQDNGGEWFRVFRKNGLAFVHKSCFRG